MEELFIQLVELFLKLKELLLYLEAVAEDGRADSLAFGSLKLEELFL